MFRIGAIALFVLVIGSGVATGMTSHEPYHGHDTSGGSSMCQPS